MMGVRNYYNGYFYRMVGSIRIQKYNKRLKIRNYNNLLRNNDSVLV